MKLFYQSEWLKEFLERSHFLCVYALCKVIKYYVVVVRFATAANLQHLTLCIIYLTNFFRFLFEHEMRICSTTIYYREYNMIYLNSSICPFSHLLYLLPSYNKFYAFKFFQESCNSHQSGVTRKVYLK